MTDPLGQSQVIPYIKGLSEKGYKYTLISCEKSEMFDKYKGDIERLLKESDITWVPIIYHKSPPILSTVYDFLKLRTLAVSLHKSTSFQLVHCRSYISSLIGLYMKRKFNIPFIFDMRGFWADERVDGKLWNLNNPLYNLIYKFFKKKEYQILATCAAAVSLTEAGKKEMLKWEVLKKYTTPVFVIPCSVDFRHFTIIPEKEKNEQRKLLGIRPDQFVLSYLGSIGTWYLLGDMLDFFKLLLNRYPDAVFFFLTADKEYYVREEALKKGIPQKNLMVRFAPRKEIVKMIGVSDASIFLIKPAFSKISSSPTKLGELLAMGIPVICNSRVGDVKEIVESSNAGIVLDNFNTTEFSSAIDRMEQYIGLEKERMREKALSYYSLDKAVDNYALMYKTALK